MSLNTGVADTIQENNIITKCNQYYPEENLMIQQEDSQYLLSETQGANIDQSIPSYISPSTTSISSIVCQQNNAQLSEISNSVNKILSDLVCNSISCLDNQVSNAKGIQCSSPSSINSDTESEDNKENESMNSGILTNIQNQQCTPQSPCIQSSPSRILKRSQSNTSSTSRGTSKNDENENIVVKSKINKSSPQNIPLNVINNSITIHTTSLNKQVNQQSSNLIGSTTSLSSIKEKDQNTSLALVQSNNSSSSSTSKSTHNSSEKKRPNQSLQQTTTTCQQSNLIIGNVNEPLIIQQDQQFKQEEPSESIAISNLSQSDDLQQPDHSTLLQIQKDNNENQNEMVENTMEHQKTDEQLQKVEEVEINNNNSQEEIQLITQVECEENQVSEINFDNTTQIQQPQNQTENKEGFLQFSSDEDKEIQNVNDFSEQNQSQILSLNEQKQEQQINEIATISPLLEENNQQEDIQINEGVQDLNDDCNDDEEDDEQIIKPIPINIIGAEEDDEDEEEEEQKIYEEQDSEKEIEDQQYQNENNKENEEQENKENFNSELNQNLQAQQFEDCDEQEEQVEKSETIKHLESYQGIIKETDNYLDQLVMYMIKEKETLTNIQKSIQGRRSTRTTSPPIQQQSNQEQDQSHSQTTQYKQEQIKQKNEEVEYQYSNQKDQRAEDRSRRNSSSGSNQNSVVSQKQYQQTQHPSKGYNNYQQYQQVANRQTYSHVNEILSISVDSIKFGVVFPGNIFEEQVQIANKTNEMVFIKVVGLCLNPEFDSHGEYVYSIRKTINYDYNEKLMFSIAPYSSIKIHCALKVPNINQEKIIKGSFAVTVNGYDTYISIPITSSVEIPKIVCTRQLFHSSRSSKVIKLAIRRGKKSDCKIPFKNTYGYSLQLEPFWLTDQTNEQHITNIKDGSLCPFYLNLTPQLVTVQPKSLFMINLLLRPNQYFKDYNEKRIVSGDKTPLHIKNVLILRVANSSLLLHFPVSLEVY